MVQSIDQKLLSYHLSDGFNELERREILAHLIAKLESSINISVSITDVRCFPNADGFAAEFIIPSDSHGLLATSGFGTISATVVGNREATAVEATFFVRGCGRRLVAIDGAAYLWSNYKLQASGEYNWSYPIWTRDEFGEYENWK